LPLPINLDIHDSVPELMLMREWERTLQLLEGKTGITSAGFEIPCDSQGAPIP
jgi:hypothetical protein